MSGILSLSHFQTKSIEDVYIKYALSGKLTTVQIAEIAGPCFNHLNDTSLTDRWGPTLVDRVVKYWASIRPEDRARYRALYDEFALSAAELRRRRDVAMASAPALSALRPPQPSASPATAAKTAATSKTAAAAIAAPTSSIATTAPAETPRSPRIEGSSLED